MIYKICTSAEWREAEERGSFTGSAVDVADGFIHFSTAAQVEETARRHFAGETDLVLVAVDPAALGDALKWEPSRGGDLFPHLYGALPATAAKKLPSSSALNASATNTATPRSAASGSADSSAIGLKIEYPVMMMSGFSAFINLFMST